MEKIVIWKSMGGRLGLEWAWNRVVEIPKTCLLYCCEASVRAWMYQMMKELLVCYSSIAMSTIAVV